MASELEFRGAARDAADGGTARPLGHAGGGSSPRLWGTLLLNPKNQQASEQSAEAEHLEDLPF